MSSTNRSIKMFIIFNVFLYLQTVQFELYTVLELTGVQLPNNVSAINNRWYHIDLLSKLK